MKTFKSYSDLLDYNCNAQFDDITFNPLTGLWELKEGDNSLILFFAKVFILKVILITITVYTLV